MKIKDILPETPYWAAQDQNIAMLSNTLGLTLSKAEGDKYTPQTIGLEHLVNDWIRRQAAYRYQLISDLITIYSQTAEIRGPILHLKQEVFRKGFSWKSKFAVICEKCETEYQDKVDECEKCKENGELKEPDESQKTIFNEFMKDCNIWDQSLEEVLKQFYVDANIVDDAFLYIAKEYKDAEGQIVSKPLEIRRLHPALIEFDMDQNGMPKNRHFFCLIHRDTIKEAGGRCQECGYDLTPAMYIYHRRTYQGKSMYLTDNEVIHISKFDETETYGWSPILTIFEKALTLIGMDKMLFRYFYERKMPASMLMVFTDDIESLRRERDYLAAELRRNPDYVPLVGVSAKSGNRGRADMVRLFHTLQEMDYMPVKQEIRERIAALWGVTPIWQGAADSLGGLSSQSQQLTVMSRVVEGDQRIFHEKVFPYLLDAFGITDWLLELQQPEEKADTTRMALSQQKVATANMLFQMGFDIKIKSGSAEIMDVDFEVSGEAKRMNMFGGGGFGGGTPEQPQPGQEQETEGIPEERATEGNQEIENKSFGSPLSMMQKSMNWIGQIIDTGYPVEKIEKVSDDFKTILFSSIGNNFQASFYPNGKLMTIVKIEPKLHNHDNFPPHEISQSHNATLNKPTQPNDVMEDT